MSVSSSAIGFPLRTCNAQMRMLYPASLRCFKVAGMSCSAPPGPSPSIIQIIGCCFSISRFADFRRCLGYDAQDTQSFQNCISFQDPNCSNIPHCTGNRNHDQLNDRRSITCKIQGWDSQCQQCYPSNECC